MKNYLQEYNNQVIGTMSEDEKNASSSYSFYTVDATITFGGYGGGSNCCCFEGPGLCVTFFACEGCCGCLNNFELQQTCWWFPSPCYCWAYDASSPEERAGMHAPILWYIFAFGEKHECYCCEIWNKCCYSDKLCCECCEMCTGDDYD